MTSQLDRLLELHAIREAQDAPFDWQNGLNEKAEKEYQSLKSQIESKLEQTKYVKWGSVITEDQLLGGELIKHNEILMQELSQLRPIVQKIEDAVKEQNYSCDECGNTFYRKIKSALTSSEIIQ